VISRVLCLADVVQLAARYDGGQSQLLLDGIQHILIALFYINLRITREESSLFSSVK
jgi:hypothetical protein